MYTKRLSNNINKLITWTGVLEKIEKLNPKQSLFLKVFGEVSVFVLFATVTYAYKTYVIGGISPNLYGLLDSENPSIGNPSDAAKEQAAELNAFAMETRPFVDSFWQYYSVPNNAINKLVNINVKTFLETIGGLITRTDANVKLMSELNFKALDAFQTI